MKIAMMTMVYNDHVALGQWISHYSRQLPSAQLLIVDHGSDTPLQLNLSNISIIRLKRSSFDDRRRAEMISMLQSALLHEFDYVGYADADELIVAKDEFLLEDSLSRDICCEGVLVACGVNIWHRPSCESGIDFKKPLLGQRRLGIIEKSMCKPFMSKYETNWIPGFHTSNLKPLIGSGYFLFHLKYMDYEIAAKRLLLTNSIEWSMEAIEKGWGRHQRIKVDDLNAKYKGVEKINLQDVPDLLEVSEKYMREFADGFVLDSKGNFRCDAQLSATPVSITKNLLKKLINQL